MVAAYQYFRFADRRRREEAPLEWITLGWGLLWWGTAVLTEVDAATTGARMVPALSAAFAATGVVLAAIARWRTWPALACFCLPLLPILALLALGSYLFDGQPGPWSNGGAAAWPAAMAGSFLLLWLLDPILWPRVARAWHAGTTWLLVFLLTWTAASGAALAVPESPTWSLRDVGARAGDHRAGTRVFRTAAAMARPGASRVLREGGSGGPSRRRSSCGRCGR